MAPASTPSRAVTLVDMGADEILTGEAVALDVQPIGLFLRAVGALIDFVVGVVLLVGGGLLLTAMIGAGTLPESAIGIGVISLLVVVMVARGDLVPSRGTPPAARLPPAGRPAHPLLATAVGTAVGAAQVAEVIEPAVGRITDLDRFTPRSGAGSRGRFCWQRAAQLDVPSLLDIRCRTRLPIEHNAASSSSVSRSMR